jgi:hypothetical protein
MKKKLFLFLITIISINSYSQVSYEKGYYIDNFNQKVNCLIKNIDWNNNPINFEYKFLISDESKKANIESIKEFGIYKTLKYIRNTVEIEKSSNNVNKINHNKEPQFKEEQLFLKVIVEGKANLYLYENGALKKYFYNKDSSNIKQLVFKKFITSKGKISKNEQFKIQLWKNLKCSKFKMNTFEGLKYKKNSLIKLFIEYNKCINSNFINYEVKQKKDLFNLTIKTRINNSSLTVNDNLDTGYRASNFGNKTSIGFGVELEYILPFNKNKWSISLEPTYQGYKSKTTKDSGNLFDGQIISEVDFNAIELPITLRHYLFLNNNSKFFINASFVLDFNSKESIIEYNRADNTTLFTPLSILTSRHFAFGIGYKISDKFGIELRHHVNREILGGYITTSSEYKTSSLIFGYTIF